MTTWNKKKKCRVSPQSHIRGHEDPRRTTNELLVNLSLTARTLSRTHPPKIWECRSAIGQLFFFFFLQEREGLLSCSVSVALNAAAVRSRAPPRGAVNITSRYRGPTDPTLMNYTRTNTNTHARGRAGQGAAQCRRTTPQSRPELPGKSGWRSQREARESHLREELVVVVLQDAHFRLQLPDVVGGGI